MRVALIHPNWNLHDLKFTTASIRPPKSIPLELTYTAASLDGVAEAQIFDAYASGKSFEELSKEVADFKPDLAIVETTPTYLFWRCPPLDLSVPKKVINDLREKLDSKVAVIGPHGTNDPEWTMRNTKADVVIRGESDFVFRDMLQPRSLSLSNINGVYTGEATGIAEVDMKQLPFPAFELLNLSLYEPHAWFTEIYQNLAADSQTNFALEYSRGCVFRCDFCFMDGFRQVFRAKTPEQMERELDFVVENGGTYIYFIDEIFNKPSAGLDVLLRQLKERGLKFGHQSRPDIMSEDLLERMADSGCVYIEYGLETRDQRASKAIKKNVKQDKVNRIVELTRQYIPGVNAFHINFYAPDYVEILGLEEKPVEEWDPKPIRPYPGTTLGEKLFEKYGVTDNKWDFALRYVWWLQIEYVHRKESEIPNIGGVKQTILFGDYENAREVASGILEEHPILFYD